MNAFKYYVGLMNLREQFCFSVLLGDREGCQRADMTFEGTCYGDDLFRRFLRSLDDGSYERIAVVMSRQDADLLSATFSRERCSNPAVYFYTEADSPEPGDLVKMLASAKPFFSQLRAIDDPADVIPCVVCGDEDYELYIDPGDKRVCFSCISKAKEQPTT